MHRQVKKLLLNYDQNNNSLDNKSLLQCYKRQKHSGTFKSRQGRELLILNKKEFNHLNLNTIIVWVYEKWIMVNHGCPFVADTNWTSIT